MTVERAAHIVLDLAGDRCDWLPSDLVRAPEFCDRAYKLAAMQCHPDRAGSEADFLRLQQAADLLKRYHAGAL